MLLGHWDPENLSMLTDRSHFAIDHLWKYLRHSQFIGLSHTLAVVTHAWF